MTDVKVNICLSIPESSRISWALRGLAMLGRGLSVDVAMDLFRLANEIDTLAAKAVMSAEHDKSI